MERKSKAGIPWTFTCACPAVECSVVTPENFMDFLLTDGKTNATLYLKDN